MTDAVKNIKELHEVLVRIENEEQYYRNGGYGEKCKVAISEETAAALRVAIQAVANAIARIADSVEAKK